MQFVKIYKSNICKKKQKKLLFFAVSHKKVVLLHVQFTKIKQLKNYKK